MTKTRKNMDSHSYPDVHDENPYKNNMDSHSYKDVHDENQNKKNTNMDIQITKLYMTKTYNPVNSTRKMMKFTKNDKGQCDIMND